MAITGSRGTCGASPSGRPTSGSSPRACLAKTLLSGLWGFAAIAVLLWPDHLAGDLDGAPLDQLHEAILIGLFVPFLCWLHPDYLRHRLTRALIVMLVVAKIGSSFLP